MKRVNRFQKIKENQTKVASIAFEDVPKFALTSNFVVRNHFKNKKMETYSVQIKGQ